MMSRYTVYCHTNKVNGKKYIGITTMRPERRWANGLGYRSQSCFFEAIQMFGWHNFSHEVLYTNLEKEEAERIEMQLICEYDSANPDHGYNTDHGGLSSYKMGEAHKEKLRQKKLGTKLSEETRNKISERTKGDKNPMYGKKRNVADYKTIRVKCEESGIVYLSMADASRKTGINQGDISKACNGKLKSAGGFRWSKAIGGD